MSLKIFKYTKKVGVQTIIIDYEDWAQYQKGSWGFHTTKRHNSIYVVVNNSKKGKIDGYNRLHRLLLSASKDLVVDYINGNALDNRRCNLRLTTQNGNNKNAAKRRNAITSNYKGTHKSSDGKWKSQIQKDGKKYTLGTYNTEIEAAEAYNKSAIKLHGEYAKLNIIKDAK